MAFPKNFFLLLALLFALALLISSEVAASEESMKTNGVGEVKYGGAGYGGGGGYPGRGCRYGCCRRYRYGPGCKRCCGSAHEAPDAEFEDDVKN